MEEQRMLATETTTTPVGQIILLSLEKMRWEGQDGATRMELIRETGRKETAVRRGLKDLLDQQRIQRIERVHPSRNCPIAVLYRLSD